MKSELTIVRDVEANGERRPYRIIEVYPTVDGPRTRVLGQRFATVEEAISYVNSVAEPPVEPATTKSPELPCTCADIPSIMKLMFPDSQFVRADCPVHGLDL